MIFTGAKFFLLFFLSVARAEPNISCGNSAKLWDRYKKNLNTDPTIPNNSYAGFNYGEPYQPKVMPEISVKKFGAKGDGFADDTQAFENALAAAKNGAIVKIPNGKFHLSRRLVLGESNIILRGSGNSLLVFDHSLSDLDPKENEANGASPFAWNEGLIHIGPQSDFSGSHLKKITGWNLEKEIAFVNGSALRGQFELPVSDSSQIHAGDLLFIEYGNPADHSLLNYMAGFNEKSDFSWEKNGKKWLTRKLPWPVEVAGVKPGKIILKQPLRLDILPKWGARLIKSNDFIHHVGLENIKIKMISGESQKHLSEKGFNAIFFHKVIHSWAKNISIEDADSGILLNATKNISLSKIKLMGKRKFHHGIYTKSTHDALISDFEISAPMIHGINADMFGSGNVWHKGKMLHGTFDMHRGMQFDLIRTNIEITNDGNAGGEADSGPQQGIRAVHWNILYCGKNDWVNDPQFMPSGELVAVSKRRCKLSKKDLYEAELQLRLKSK